MQLSQNSSVSRVPTCRYMEENGLAAMAAAKRSAGVIPEVSLRKCVTCMPPPSANKAAHSDTEAALGDITRSQKPRKKDLCPPKILDK